MELNKIDSLIKKYENGETSLQEEQQLKQYFLEDRIAPHLEIYKPMFSYFSKSKQEKLATPLVLESRKTLNYKWLAVAAAIAIMFGLYFKEPVVHSYNNYVYGTYNTPEEAFKEVTTQLTMISNHFNKGVSTVNYLENVNKGTKTLGYLNEIENATSIIFKVVK